MPFNSLAFAVFFPIVLVLYWSVVRGLRAQNVLLLAASWFFYACWEWRFLFLLVFSTFLCYYTGQRIHTAATASGKRTWLVWSVVLNVGVLGVFKYYGFFATSFAQFMQGLGLNAHLPFLSTVLPVGISFYTFHGLSYVFDIHRGHIVPCRDPVAYAVFVGFFPLLVAGPIERATHLLPQVQQPRRFERARASDGLRQVLWGLFKKVVIADHCADHVDNIFGHAGTLSGATLVVGAVLFAIQIYGDFSGYSDIALGTARLLGIELLQNFNYPYFARDIAEFWRRWHISLTSWFRDYLYIPLGGSRGNTWMRVRNTFVIFLLSGLWHGANWTFIAWGALNALYFLPLLLARRNRQHLGTVAPGRLMPSAMDVLRMGLTFALVCFGWIFFRAADLAAAFQYVGRMCTGLADASSYREAWVLVHDRLNPVLPVMVLVMLALEWLGREERFALAAWPGRWPVVARWGVYYALLACIVFYGGRSQQFIYFQF